MQQAVLIMEPVENMPGFNLNQLVIPASEELIHTSLAINASGRGLDLLLLATVNGYIGGFATEETGDATPAATDENGNAPLPRGGFNANENGTTLNNVTVAAQAVKDQAVKDQAWLVSRLIAAGANVNCVNENLNSPLILASVRGGLTTLGLLLEAGANVNYGGRDGDTPLIHAARRGHVKVAQRLIEAGACLEAESVNGETPLLAAARYRKLSTVRFLLARGADVNHANLAGCTALMVAVKERCLDTCVGLIEAGADVNTVDAHGNNALIYAAKLDSADIAARLIAAGSRLDQINCHSKSALWFAVCHSVVSYSACLRQLLSLGVPVGLELHQAVCCGMLNIVKEFIGRGDVRPFRIDVSKLNVRSVPPHLDRISPMAVALLTSRLDIAKYFWDTCFLTHHDVCHLANDTLLQQFLRDHGKTESADFMDQIISHSCGSLEKLTQMKISWIIGFDSRYRRNRIYKTGLPLVHQKTLLGEGPNESKRRKVSSIYS